MYGQYGGVKQGRPLHVCSRWKASSDDDDLSEQRQALCISGEYSSTRIENRSDSFVDVGFPWRPGVVFLGFLGIRIVQRLGGFRCALTSKPSLTSMPVTGDGGSVGLQEPKHAARARD
jgi:hypothetical protein